MENHGVTLAQYLDPVWRKEFMRKTGFVDVLSLGDTKSQHGITQPNGDSDTHRPEPLPRTES